MPMFETFPTHYEAIMDWQWSHFEPYAEYLRKFELDDSTITQWLKYETHFFGLIEEMRTRLSIRLDGDTAHQATQQQLNHFSRVIQPHVEQLQQELRRKLLASDLQPAHYEIPLRQIQATAGMKMQDTAELNAEIQQLRVTYQQISSSQVIEWNGTEKPLTHLIAAMNTPNRAKRETLYQRIQAHRVTDKLHFDNIWSQLMLVRKQMIHQSNMANFRDLRWRELKRLDYTPRDVMDLCNAIERAVVPLVARLHNQLRKRLQVDALRPWDLYDNPAEKMLNPYRTVPELLDKFEKLFFQIDNHFGNYFQTMRRDNLLDIEARPNKAANGYSTLLPYSKQPFIFWNLRGTHEDVTMLIHEAGHAFHTFESAHWPTMQQRRTTDEMNELAAMTLEMLALDHYDMIYSDDESVRYARLHRLEQALHYLIDAAMTVTFQHWAYSYHEAATDAACCDAKWRELLLRYFPGIDFRGLEHQMLTPWWHNYRIFFMPFYAIEYALAQLGAVHIWQAARANRTEAVSRYRAALALGNTQSLPDLYQAAGASLVFDEASLQQAVAAIATELVSLEAN